MVMRDTAKMYYEELNNGSYFTFVQSGIYIKIDNNSAIEVNCHDTAACITSMNPYEVIYPIEVEEILYNYV